MTPKEKALGLVYAFENAKEYANSSNAMSRELAKECALVAVGEMLYTVDGLEDSVWSISATDFLKDVKQELEKL
jgi:hypothetical protein